MEFAKLVEYGSYFFVIMFGLGLLVEMEPDRLVVLGQAAMLIRLGYYEIVLRNYAKGKEDEAE